MVGRSCCFSCGIAIAPNAIAMRDIRPIRARCARLNLDSQDMGQGSLFCERQKWRGGPSTLWHACEVIRSLQDHFLIRRLLRAQYGTVELTPPLDVPAPTRTRSPRAGPGPGLSAWPWPG